MQNVLNSLFLLNTLIDFSHVCQRTVFVSESGSSLFFESFSGTNKTTNHGYRWVIFIKNREQHTLTSSSLHDYDEEVNFLLSHSCQEDLQTPVTCLELVFLQKMHSMSFFFFHCQIGIKIEDYVFQSRHHFIRELDMTVSCSLNNSHHVTSSIVCDFRRMESLRLSCHCFLEVIEFLISHCVSQSSWVMMTWNIRFLLLLNSNDTVITTKNFHHFHHFPIYLRRLTYSLFPPSLLLLNHSRYYSQTF